MTVLEVAVLALATLPLGMVALNLAVSRPTGGAVPAGTLVSVLVPARDEESNIGACLEAVLASVGVAVEVVVMDDGSRDGTARIVEDLAARDGRVRLERCPALPPGWTGKVHACARLAEAARGTHLLFLDADVRLAPRAAAAMAGHAATRGLALVSGVPRQEIGTLGEALTVPAINLLMLGYLPGAGRAFTAHPAMAAACGQLILVEASAYRAAGGHAAVRGVLHDGLALARLLRTRGHRTEVVDGAPLATCRMYRSFGEAWGGFLKNACEGMATPVGLPVWTALLFGGHVAPWLLLPAPGAAAGLVAGYVVRAAVTWRGREPSWTVPLHPATVLVALAIQWTALARSAMGRRAGWKGRSYAAAGEGAGEDAVEGMADAAKRGVGEAPTRTPATENFPVASVLLSRAVRPKVLAFYRFVRAADDLADDPALPAADKLARLDAMEAALDDPATTMPEAVGMHARAVGTGEARRMLSAFRQDATRARYDDWAELQDYCARSAAPVGRMLLRLHGTDGAEAVAASDALCEALQVLNHLQDLVPDRAAMDRIYLPVPWMALAGGEAAFFAGSEGYPLKPGVTVRGEAGGGPRGVAPEPRPADAAPRSTRREVLDAALDRVEEALDRASALPRLIASRRLALEAAVTLGCARLLLGRLRAADPVVGRVALGRADFVAALAAAPRAVSPLLSSGTDAAVVRAHVARAGSSFGRGMAALRGERRRGLWAVYAFCRAVDDIADNAMPEDEKRRFLAGWRGKLDRPDCALSRELRVARERFGLPRAECEAMIAGMETDAGPRVRLADEAALELYCRRVAGSVGAMSVRIFGAEGADGGAAERFALGLGRTLQLVNILRDLDEDAGRDRVYVPLSLLGGEAGLPAAALLAGPGLVAACDLLAARARDGFRQAEVELARLDAGAMRPARVMMWGYGRLLDRMLARGFADRRERPRLTRAEKVRMAWLALGGGTPGRDDAMSGEARAA